MNLKKMEKTTKNEMLKDLSQTGWAFFIIVVAVSLVFLIVS